MTMADGMIDVQYCMVSEGVTADACNGSGRLRWNMRPPPIDRSQGVDLSRHFVRDFITKMLTPRALGPL